MAAPEPEEAGAGVHDEEEMTDAMREVRRQAIALHGTPLTAAQQAYLSSSTLCHFVDPPRPKPLVVALRRRHAQHTLLNGEVGVPLVGSLRVVGWDRDGSTILSWETSTQRAAFTQYMPQFEYVVNTALDLCTGTSRNFIIISHYPDGYFDPLKFLNPAALLELASMLESQFRRRLKAAIMVGMPRSFQKLFNVRRENPSLSPPDPRLR